ncbi:flagellar protein [Chenggangzhangella methanolivorans]|uniref:Flagellar protein n=1 Tax=Chenggangzhangella methanolivorans TaxID=1437009 RepID=A0A9E6RAW9_9HYPH|nr:flagellar protein [Chenggangzhangella methanolivorans]QZO01000.1 flagellar protein [Chenggangzhangella methanolivorans]
MAEITLNSAVRSNLRTLQSTTDLMNRTEERLSTGKKVNSAFDNPASFFTSQALDRRASTFNNLLDSVSNSVQTLKAADNGITAISKVVESLKATARSAVQSTQAVTSKASVTSAAIANLSESNLIGGTFTNNSATGTAVLNNNSTTAVAITGATKLSGAASTTSDSLASGIAAGESITVNGTKIDFVSSGATGNQVNITDDVTTLIQKIDSITGASTASSVTAGAISISTGTNQDLTLSGSTGTLAKLGLTAGTTARTAPTDVNLQNQSLTVQDKNGVNRTVTFSRGGIDTLDKLNKFFDDNNIDLQGTVAVDPATKKGTLTLQTTNAAADSTPATLTGSAVATGQAFNGAATFSTPVVGGAGKDVRDSFVKDYNNALKQISTLAKDASYNGVNLLNGDDLDIVFNEDGSSNLNVKGVQFDATGLQLGDLQNIDFYDSNSINDVLSALDDVSSKLETQSSKFGSQLQIVQTRQDFTKDMIGTLEDGSAALTSADTNAEAANLATLQTRQSLIVSALSISTSQEQNVLQLLR